MALHVRLEARLDRLADPLIDLLAVPSGGPLARDVVIVPSLGVGRWLQQRVAQRLGISAGWRPEFAGRYLWALLAGTFPDLPARSPFDPELSRWSLMALLGELPLLDELAPLHGRLAKAPLADRLELATDIAAHFDRYLAYRRDWLERWQAGQWARAEASLSRHEAWQRWLWRALLQRLPRISQQHPYDRLLDALRADPLGVARALSGRRVMLFGAVDLSPEQFSLFGVLSNAMDVHVFAPDPCREFWQDMVTPSARARVALTRPDEAWLYDGEPAVLAHWGRAQRDFGVQVMALAEQCQAQVEEPLREQAHAFADPSAALPERPSCLQAIQLSLFLASDAPWASCAGPDRSLQIHATHGVTRSAEVLHDLLLECFDEDPTLQPHEVAVFCADIDSSLPAIEAVFGAVPAGRAIPLSISGRNAAVDPVLRAITELWPLVRQGVPLPSLARWLENPVLMHTLQMDDESLDRLLGLFDEAGARWGMTPDRGPAKHSWQAAIDRLLLGAAMGGAAQPLGEQQSVPGVTPGSGEPLRPWLRIHEALEQLDTVIGTAQPAAAWCDLTDALADQLLAGDHPWRDSLQQLRDVLARLREGSAHEPALVIDSTGFEQALTQALQQGAMAAFPGAAVTVCPLGGLRGVHWRVIVLFGMDEGAWPRGAPHGEFDLLARAPRFGDRLARTDDRGVFLDALLACDDRLLILYQGRDARDDSILNQSPVVAELLDYLLSVCPGSSPENWVTQAPVHRFSLAGFRGLRASYAAEWLAAAQALALPLAQRPADIGAFAEAPPALELAVPAHAAPVEPRQLAAESPPVVLELSALAADLTDPHKRWWRAQFGLRLPFEPPALAEIEPLGSPLARDAQLLASLAGALLAGATPADLVHQTSVLPMLASAGTGRYQARQLVDSARRLLIPATAFISAPPVKPGGGAAPLPLEPAEIDIVRLTRCLQPMTLSAQVQGHIVRSQALLFPELGLQLVVAAYPLRARTHIEAWLAHAVWQCAQPAQGKRTTIALASNGFTTVDFNDGEAALAHALTLWQRCGEAPLPLFADAWLAARKHDGPDLSEELLDAIETALQGDDQQRGAALSRPWAGALYRGSVPDFGAVVQASREAYEPIFSQCS